MGYYLVACICQGGAIHAEASITEAYYKASITLLNVTFSGNKPVCAAPFFLYNFITLFGIRNL